MNALLRQAAKHLKQQLSARFSAWLAETPEKVSSPPPVSLVFVSIPDVWFFMGLFIFASFMVALVGTHARPQLLLLGLSTAQQAELLGPARPTATQ